MLGRKEVKKMGYTQNDLEKINTALNCLEAVRVRILEDLNGKKGKAPAVSKPLNDMGELNKELTVKQC